MSVLASSILNRARVQLIDNGSTYRWTDAELLQWLSDGQRTVVAAIPWAYQITTTVALAAGTYQTLPSDCYKLLTVYRNVKSGAASGYAVTPVDRAILDRQNSSWHVTGATPDILHYSYDENDPQAFLVWPSSDGTGSVLVNYSAMPSDITSGEASISVKDVFQTPLFDYVMFRAHSKDSDFAAGQQLAAGYLASFTAFLQSMSSVKG